MPANLADIFENSDRTALATQQPVEERLTCGMPDGRVVTVLATHILLRHADGTPCGICGIFHDITDLETAQREFERLWLHAPEPLCIVGIGRAFQTCEPGLDASAWVVQAGWLAVTAELLHPTTLPSRLRSTARLPPAR